MSRYTFKGSFKEWDEISEKIHNLLKSCNVSESNIRKIMMALEEEITNIISYNDEETDIILNCETDTGKNEIIFTVEDSGVPFDPTAVKDADTSAEAVRNRVGGMGVTMVRKLMDKTSYSYDGRNIFTMTKYLGDNET